jgi:hypothetical protein
MDARLRAVSMIGGARVLVEQRAPEQRFENLVAVDIPDSELAGITEVLLLRCCQQSLITPAIWDAADVIREGKRPEARSAAG